MTGANDMKELPGSVWLGTLAGIAGMATVLSGCVTVEAPEKPIVINLNINIKQEVVYRLDGDAKALIDEQGDIF